MARDGRPLAHAAAELFPGEDPAALIAAGEVLVDGVPVTNPRSRLRPGARVTRRPATSLRGSAKLRAALEAFAVDVAGRVAMDVGAAAGGFTTVLLEAGARRVYAVDAGHGQLLGSLRQDPRVVNLESVNVADLDRDRVPDPDRRRRPSTSPTSASPRPSRSSTASPSPRAAHLVALVKPMFELRAATAPSDRASLDAALAAARRRGDRSRAGRCAGRSTRPVTGSRGARESCFSTRASARSVTPRTVICSVIGRRRGAAKRARALRTPPSGLALEVQIRPRPG